MKKNMDTIEAKDAFAGKRLLITGAPGFIGHHMVEHILNTMPDTRIVSLDRLDTSGNLNRLTDTRNFEEHMDRLDVVFHDLKAPIDKVTMSQLGRVDAVLHLAAASHVDRSITHPMEFVQDNIVGTVNLLDAFRGLGTPFLYFSTDEVYGPAPHGCNYVEGDRHNPGNPYAATKSAAESMVRAYRNTYDMPLLISNTMNVFGERQHVEKYIPGTIAKILKGETVIVHSDETCFYPGSRFYLHALNAVDAALFILANGDSGESEDAACGTYHIVGEREVDNLELAQLIAMCLFKPLKHELVDFHSSRPGHDLRYAMSGSKLASMGYTFPVTFEQSLRVTIKWYLDNPGWLEG